MNKPNSLKIVTGFLAGILVAGGFATLNFTGDMSQKAKENEFIIESRNAVQWQLNSGEAEALQYQAYNTAIEKLQAKVQKPSEKPKAVILDIDETVVNNYGSLIDTYSKSTDGYSKEEFTSWVKEEKATAIAGAKDFLNKAKENGVEVFYISNRYAEDVDATINNFKKLGLPYADADHIMVKQKASNKMDRVEKVKESHDVIMYVGDNLNDFPAGFDKKSNKERKAMVQAMEDKFGTDFIIIPNAVYGDWSGATFGYDYSKTPEQQIQDRDNALMELRK